MDLLKGDPECPKCQGKGVVLLEEKIFYPFRDEESFKAKFFGECTCVSDSKLQGERRAANG